MKTKLLFIWILTFILLISIASAVNPPTGGVLYYNFSSVTDLWGTSDGTNNGGTSQNFYPTYNTIGDSSPNSYIFDGSVDYVNSNLHTDFTTSGFSMSIWINTTTIEESYLIATTDEQGDNDVLFYFQVDESNSESFDFRIRGDGGANLDQLTGTTDINDGDWYHGVVTYNATSGNLSLYTNGVLEDTKIKTFTGNIDNPTHEFYIGALNNRDSRQGEFHGNIDEVKIFNITLSKAQISKIYNNGSLHTVPSNFTVTVKDIWDNSPVNNITVNVNGVNYTNNAGSMVTTHLYQNNTNTFNITVYSNENTYFNRTFYNISVSSNYIAKLVQSQINFSAFELITNNSLTGINYTIDGKTHIINDVGFFNLSAGTYNVTANKNGYFSVTQEITVLALDNKTFNITGISNSRLVITPKFAFNNVSISSFTGWIYDNNNSYNVSFSSTNGTSYVNVLNSTYITAHVFPSGYASQTINFTVINNSFPVKTYHYTFNSVRINIYNDTSTSLLAQNVSIISIWGTESDTFYTVNGTYVLHLLDPASYELRFSSSGYLDTSLFISVTNDSTQEINVYLPFNTSKELQRFVVVDQVGATVSASIIRLQREVPTFVGLWQTVDEKLTNTDGETGFYVDKSTSVFYRMIVIYNDTVKLITDKTLFLPTVSDIISLQIDLSDAGEDTAISEVVTSLVTSGVSNETYTFSWVDGANSIVGGRLVVYTEDFNLTGVPASILSDVSLNGFTGSLNYTLPVVNNTRFTVKAYIVYNGDDGLVHEEIVIFGISIIPDKNLGLLIGAVLMLFVAFITISLKPLFSSVLTISVLGILNVMKLIHIPTTVITSFIALAIIFFIKIKKGER